MKARVNDTIKTLVEVKSDFSNRIIPKGTVGTVIESYKDPEGYAVDLAIPNESLVGGFAYENVLLRPDQFTVVDSSKTT